MSNSVEKIDPKESELMQQLNELCTMSTMGIVRIAENTKTSPVFVAKMYVSIFQNVLIKLESESDDA